MNQALTRELTTELEKVIIGGDLRTMTPVERLNFYNATCQSLGLNPLTRPFEYITLNGKLTLYARKDATEQLRAIHGISITKLEREVSEGVYCVTSYLVNKDGRQDSSIGAVSIEGLKGEAKANAMMKAETKSKRRGTLSICGLGLLDETEVETIPSAQPFVEREEKPAVKSIPDSYVEEHFSDMELGLARQALSNLMAHPVFSDTDRAMAHKWLGKNPSLEAVKKKLQEKKGLLPENENPDADRNPVAEGQAF